MIDCKYEELIELINSHSISKVQFKVKDYSHYNNCKFIIKEDTFNSKNGVFLIDIILTKDGSENICFYDKFKEDYKLFYLGKLGSFTLKQLWNRVEIINIE